MSVTLYFSTVSSNQEIKKHQQRIQMILDGKKIPYDVVDVAASQESKAKMREIANNPTAVPPQIANGDTYCGQVHKIKLTHQQGVLQKKTTKNLEQDYSAFDEAVELETLEEFLKLK